MIRCASIGLLLVTGCAWLAPVRQGGPPAGPGGWPADSVSGAGRSEKSVADQLGLINAAVQGVTGLSFNSAAPWSIVVLLLVVVILSHVREMRRIRVRDPPGPPTEESPAT